MYRPRLFFPADSAYVSLLLTVGTFGVGFAMRPVGAVVLGAIADQKGRRIALSWTISTMVLGTFIITFCPTYASIGIAAPLLIVVARLIQGFSSGGEMGTAVAFLLEKAPRKHRILFASFQQLMQVSALAYNLAVTLFGGLAPSRVLLSLIGASVLNTLVAWNHRPDWYIAR
jgi:MHS family proline/betaine transporter-like MFS transporter